MKITKRFIAILMALCLSLSMSVVAFAADTTESDKSNTEHVNLPSDAVVLYDDGDLVFYTSELQSEYTAKATAADPLYVGKYIPDGDEIGDMFINNPHIGTTYGTLRVESNSNLSACQFFFYPPGQPYKYFSLRPYNNDVYFSFSGTGECKIHYMANSHGGMQLNCWIYKNKPADF